MGVVSAVSQVLLFQMFLNFLDDVTQALYFGVLTGFLFFSGIILGAYLWGIFFWFRTHIGVSHQLGLNQAIICSLFAKGFEANWFKNFCSSGMTSSASGLKSLVTLSPYIWQAIAGFAVLGYLWRFASIAIFVGCALQCIVLFGFVKLSPPLYDKFQRVRSKRLNLESLFLKDFDMIRGSNRLDAAITALKSARKRQSQALVEVNRLFYGAYWLFTTIGVFAQWIAMIMLMVLPSDFSSGFTASNIASGLVACALISKGLLAVGPLIQEASFGFSDVRSASPALLASIEIYPNCETKFSEEYALTCQDAVWLGARFMDEKLVCGVCFEFVSKGDMVELNKVPLHKDCIKIARKKKLSRDHCPTCNLIVLDDDCVEKNGVSYHSKCLRVKSDLGICQSCGNGSSMLLGRCSSCRKMICDGCQSRLDGKVLCKNFCLKKTGIIFGPLSCSVKKCSFLNIWGPPRCGKTSLLRGLFREQELLSGELCLFGKSSVLDSDLFVFPGKTIRENIIFGSEFYENRYQTVVKICALDEDFLAFPSGDSLLLEENGANVSGGQLRRICLARALYFECDNVFLDNPFLGLDTKTASRVKRGVFEYLRGHRTLIIVSEEPYRDCDVFIAMNERGSLKFEANIDFEETSYHLPGEPETSSSTKSEKKAAEKLELQ